MVKIHDIIKQRILVLDGAMGTMIQQYGLVEEDFRGERFKEVPGLMKGNNDILCLTRPDVIADIHRKYLEAGADLITTCTFSSQRVSMADYNVQEYCREMNLAGARIARQLADEYTRETPMKPRFPQLQSFSAKHHLYNRHLIISAFQPLHCLSVYRWMN